ncbi:hypothetical protein [uncultured Halomonas sp.]|uniref:phage nozzle protein n=1 Tax=uncultured Halomonas sp. TaxID=173971 RepID=UPI0026328273|nr:hypothetical protein [uncultured Halomonas sp.]
MGLISSSIPNFVNGISQQPFTLRLASQGEMQENGFSTVSQGLKKRPGTKHIAKIANTPLNSSGVFVHIINRDEVERYVVVILNGDLKVYDTAGNEKVVNFPSGKAYLSAPNPQTNFRATSVADYTFILNRTVAVQEATDRISNQPFRGYEALVNVKAGNYGKTYTVFVNGATAATFTTPNGDNANQSPQISTDYIASRLREQMVNAFNRRAQAITNIAWETSVVKDGESNITYYTGANFNLEAGANIGNSTILVDGVQRSLLNGAGGKFRVTFGNRTSPPGLQAFIYQDNGVQIIQTGSVIWIKSNTDFTISSDDGFAGNAMVVIKNKLQRFSDLPNRCPVDGFVVEITGDSNSSFDNYWVKYDMSGGSTSNGVWKETCAPGLSVGMHWHTMPWALVREADGTFTFKMIPWGQRKVGDAKSNPNPSFMNRPLNDVFFYRNRLGLLCDENIIFSEAGEYFNFYRTTVTQLTDSEPIDVAVSHTKVSILEHAIPFNKQLLIFSGQTQFVLDQNDILSPKTISVKMSTEFPCSVNCKPIPVGKNVYFAVDKGDWTAVREYYADFNNLSNDSQDVTGHVPKYIPSGVFKIAASTNEDIMCLISNKEPNALYVYKYFWANNEKLQSAWSKWTFPAGNNIINAEFLQSELLLVVSRYDGVFLEKMNLSLGYSEPNEPYQVLLDRKRIVPASTTYLDNGKTRYPGLLGTAPGEVIYAVTATGGTKKAGVILPVKTDNVGPYVEGDYTGTDLIVGRQYSLKYMLSTITMKTGQAGGGQKSDTEGRLQLRKIAFNYADTGFFDVLVKPHNRNTYKYRYAGKVLGTETAIIGQPSFDTGRFIVPVMSRNMDTQITLINDSPIPCSILSADWEGFYVKRSQAV